MKKFELSVKKPEWLKDGDWDIKSTIIMNILKDFGIYRTDPSYCGIILSSELSESELKDLCVMVAGSEWQSVVDNIGSLCLVGNGICRVCGSNDVAGEEYCECLCCGSTWYEKQEPDDEEVIYGGREFENLKDLRL
jgi:hypothetical protein